jgi:F-type H+-transporting ATPase subunit gamma
VQQQVVVEPLLPLEPPTRAESAEAAATEYLFEPSPQRILEVLLPQLVEAQVLRALLESTAAFFAAQMTAMDAATRNSTEMIDSLTLYMNKLRQAAITREIIEVVSGAQAL